ncbi:hypothetical protein Tco_0921593, partial [Tanacetum coccineum]
YSHEDGYTKNGMVDCTQLRRVAAVSVAKRVTKEMETSSEIWSVMLFYMTHGVRLRETLKVANLESYRRRLQRRNASTTRPGIQTANLRNVLLFLKSTNGQMLLMGKRSFGDYAFSPVLSCLYSLVQKTGQKKVMLHIQSFASTQGSRCEIAVARHIEKAQDPAHVIMWVELGCPHKAVCSAYFHKAAKPKGIREYINIRNGMACHLHPTLALHGLAGIPKYVTGHSVMA